MGRDANHKAIERAFSQGFATTADLSGVGKGVPDIVVGHAGINALVEIKLPEGKRGGTAFSRLNHRQEAWHNRWRGMKPFVARTTNDVVEILERLEALGRVMRHLESMTNAELALLAQRLAVAANVLAHGTGALNIDGCRVPAPDEIKIVSGKGTLGGASGGWDRPWKRNPEAVAAREERARAAIEKANTRGRWPANLIHDGSDEVHWRCFQTVTAAGGRAR